MKKLLYIIILILIFFLVWFYFFSPRSITTLNVPDLDQNLYPSESIVETKHNLCPPEEDAKEKPTFSAVEKTNDSLFKSFGNFINDDGQIFAIDVVGNNASSVSKYIEEVLVCSEIVPLDKKLSTEASDLVDISEELDEKVLALHDDALIIEIYFIASMPNSSDGSIFLARDALAANPLRNEVTGNRVFANLGGVEATFLPPAWRGDSISSNDYAFDFIVDPSIGAGVPHKYKFYKEKSSRPATKNITVTPSLKDSDVYGKVRATLYYKGHRDKQKVISNGQEKSLQAARKKNGKYNFKVLGLKKSRYRVSGTLRQWRAGAFSRAPNPG